MIDNTQENNQKNSVFNVSMTVTPKTRHAIAKATDNQQVNAFKTVTLSGHPNCKQLIYNYLQTKTVTPMCPDTVTHWCHGLKSQLTDYQYTFLEYVTVCHGWAYCKHLLIKDLTMIGTLFDRDTLGGNVTIDFSSIENNLTEQVKSDLETLARILYNYYKQNQNG